MVSNSRDLCADCGDPVVEWFIVEDAVWAEACASVPVGRLPRSCVLCVGCLEDRLGRVLVAEDFPPLPVNDDDELDTVRLRVRKGSGRATAQLYDLGFAAIAELGRDPLVVAEVLGLSAEFLARQAEWAHVETIDG